MTLTVHGLINTDKSIIYFRFAFSSAKFHFSAESATRYLASTKVQSHILKLNKQSSNQDVQIWLQVKDIFPATRCWYFKRDFFNVRSLSGCGINIVMITVSVTSTVMLFYWASQISDPQVMVQYPHSIFQYFIYLLAPCLVGVFVVAAYFKRNAPMRNWIWREFKNNFLWRRQRWS